MVKLWRHYNCNKCTTLLWVVVCGVQTHNSLFDFRHSFKFESKTTTKKSFELCAVHVFIEEKQSYAWRNVICVQSAAWRMRNGHFTVLAHAKLKILMSRMREREFFDTRFSTSKTNKTEEERHFNFVLPMFVMYSLIHCKKNPLMKMHVI